MIFNGYRCLRDRIRNSNTYWRCENRGQCSRHLIQKGNQIPVVAAKRNQESNEQTMARTLFIVHLKEQIRENAMPIRKFFLGEIVNWYTVEPDSVRVLPQFNQIKNSLYRVKNLHELPNSNLNINGHSNSYNHFEYKQTRHPC